MYTINFPAIAPSAAHNFSVKTIEFKMAAVSVKRYIKATSKIYLSASQIQTLQEVVTVKVVERHILYIIIIIIIITYMRKYGMYLLPSLK